MLTVLSGSFRSGLENAFVERVLERKKDPMCPLAVIAPSTRLLDRLQLALAGSERSFLNISFHTFASLAEKIVETAGSLEKPILSDPLFFDTLVKQIVRDDKPFREFEEIAIPEGFPPAVRSTLRDLLDAGINEENVFAAVQEEFAGQNVDLGSLRSLLRLYRIYLDRLEKLPVFPRSELVRRATDLAATSEFLKGFDEILYYGFYDLTGLQVDFFHAIVKNFPSRFFFPYERDNPAFQFAKRFRDTFVQPVMTDEIVLDRKTAQAPFSVTNVSGFRDEAWFVANEIRRLHDDEKIDFSDIAVVARTKERLGFQLQEAFYDRRIPYGTANRLPLISFPFVQRALDRLNAHALAEQIFEWAEAIEITEKVLGALFEEESTSPENKKCLLDGVHASKEFSYIQPKTRWDEFVQLLRDRWTRTDVADARATHVGVSLLYAEAARGLSFKVVFLIGVEEKVFPRVVREDPFLRDDARFALNQTLGHKIGQKLTAIEEERLLFELVTTAASDRLYLVYRRTDDDGGIVGASPFLRAFADEHGFVLEDHVVSVPRTYFEKVRTAHPASLDTSDVVAGLLASAREEEALAFAKELGRDHEALARGRRLQKAIHAFSDPGVFDGLIGLVATSEAFVGGRISATALETYRLCGFKYFATRVLGLSEIETDEIESGLRADVRGQLAHKFLEAFYRRLTQDGASPISNTWSQKDYDEVFESVVPVEVPADLTLPPLVWQATRKLLREELARFVRDDVSRFAPDWQPTYFEKVVEGTLPAPLGSTRWAAKIDRIDLSSDGIRVVDYKTGRPFKGKTVSALAKKGERLQAPVYLSLVQATLEKLGQNKKNVEFQYRFVSAPAQSRTLNQQEWTDEASHMLTVLKLLADAVQAGNFGMNPGRHCDFCAVVRACRRHHSISVYRASAPMEKSS